MPENIHCRVKGCKWSAVVDDFADAMKRLRHHYRTKHPTKWRESIKRGVAKRRKKKG